MAKISKTSYKSNVDLRYQDNTTGLITEAVQRDDRTDLSDSVPFLVDSNTFTSLQAISRADTNVQFKLERTGTSPNTLYMGVQGSTGELQLFDSAVASKGIVWHTGNDGAGSGLDADLLDGIESSGFFRLNNSSNSITSFTNISVSDLVEFSIGGAGIKKIQSTGGYIQFLTNNVGAIYLGTSVDNKLAFEDLRTTPKGFEYSGDYSANYTNRSLVDKGYVDTKVTAVGSSGTTSRIQLSDGSGGFTSREYVAVSLNGELNSGGYKTAGTAETRSVLKDLWYPDSGASYVGVAGDAVEIELSLPAPTTTGGAIIASQITTKWITPATDATAEAQTDFTVLSATMLSLQKNKIGFYNASPIAKPEITGSRGGNAALESLATALSNLGLITNSTTA